MNNSLLASKNVSLEEEPQVDRLPSLIQRETELKEIIDAARNITRSRYWKVLLQKVYEPYTNKLIKDLRKETDPAKIYRLQGRLEERDKLNGLEDDIKMFLKELDTIGFQMKEIKDGQDS